MYKKFDSKLKSHVLTIFAGECYVSRTSEIISTVLGSCIAVCLHDEAAGIGGMNHFMLPENGKEPGPHLSGSSLKENELSQKSMRYGITSMEVLIAEMMKSGADRKRLTAKIFGGGKVLRAANNVTSVGDKNIGFTRAFLKMEGIPILGENVGEFHGRKIFFLTDKNSVFVKRVELEPAVIEERKYMKQLEEIKNAGTDITIF